MWKSQIYSNITCVLSLNPPPHTHTPVPHLSCPGGACPPPLYLDTAPVQQGELRHIDPPAAERCMLTCASVAASPSAELSFTLMHHFRAAAPAYFVNRNICFCENQILRMFLTSFWSFGRHPPPTPPPSFTPH